VRLRGGGGTVEGELNHGRVDTQRAIREGGVAGCEERLELGNGEVYKRRGGMGFGEERCSWERGCATSQKKGIGGDEVADGCCPGNREGPGCRRMGL